jgi:hypothetical protein
MTISIRYHDYDSKTSGISYYKCINNKKGCKARVIKKIGKEKVEQILTQAIFLRQAKAS